MGLLIAFVLALGFSFPTPAASGTNFSSTHFAIWFDPIVSRYDVDMPDVYTEVDLIPLVQRISAKFKRIMIRSFDLDEYNNKTSVTRIPEAVAIFNKMHRKGTDSPLEVLMLQKMRAINYFDDAVTKAASLANTIFPGTVNSIILDATEYSSAEAQGEPIIQEIESDLQKFKRLLLLHSFNGEQGVMLPPKLCEWSQPDMSSSLAGLFSSVSLVMFPYYPEEDGDIVEGIETFKHSFVEFGSACKAKISKFSTVRVGFQTGWPVKNCGPGCDGSSVVDFWKGMDQFAERSKSTVVLMEAFEKPQKKCAGNVFTGWWRLIGNSDYESASDYRFEEEASESETKTHGIVSSDTFSTALLQTEERYANFSKMVLSFNPIISKYYDVINYEQGLARLEQMMTTISFKFNKLLLPPIPENTNCWKDKDARKLNLCTVPREIAMRNSLSWKGDEKTELFMTHYHTHSHSNNNDYQSNSSAIAAAFSSTKFAADEANRISKGTVSTILLTCSPSEFRQWRWDDELMVQTVLPELHQIATELFQQYRLGILVPLSACGNRRFDLPVKFVSWSIESLQTIVFYVQPTRQDLLHGVDHTIGGYFRRFRFCKEKILDLAPGVDVGFQVGWSDSVPHLEKSVSGLVEFWVRMSSWAVRTNTTLFISEAFDNSVDGTSQGWWRIVGGEEEESGSELISFEDKGDLYVGEMIKKKKSHKTLFAIIVASLATILVLFGVAGAVFVFHYKRFIQNFSKGLSKEETKQFFEGGEPLTLENCPVSFITSTPYNAALEIRKNEFTVDEDGRLGAGVFAVVYRGTVQKERRQVRVAVKTTKLHSPSTALVGILSEIKILDYIGSHMNIVGIIGAHTSQLSKGKVFLFTELCGRGSLESYFRNSASCLAFKEQFGNANNEDQEQEARPLLNDDLALDLAQWSYQIADGMAFIASKNVVHADLATRNILITENKVAKISDFGLSRRLYDYSTYFKSHEEPTPWRWMSPESLRRLEFNEKTDVWAFGVTLWEIHSLGDKPFVGVKYTERFASELEGGYRLAAPRFDQGEWYSVMSKCWDACPNKRPSFSELKTHIENKLLRKEDDNYVNALQYRDFINVATAIIV